MEEIYFYHFNKQVKQNIKNGAVVKYDGNMVLPGVILTAATGRPLDGKITYSKNYSHLYIIYGYNDVTWTFTPLNKKYGPLKGNFVLYNEPRFTLKPFRSSISIQGLSKKYHQVKVNNGKWKTLTGSSISGLKANTKYKIQIRQKASKTRKATVLKVYNIKTKA